MGRDWEDGRGELPLRAFATEGRQVGANECKLAATLAVGHARTSPAKTLGDNLAGEKRLRGAGAEDGDPPIGRTLRGEISGGATTAQRGKVEATAPRSASR